VDASCNEVPVEGAAREVPAEIPFGDLARDTAALGRAWVSLISSEAALAKGNLIRIALVALVVPAVAIGIVVGLNAVVATLVYALTPNWVIAFGSVVVLNVAVLFLLLWLLRGWWRTLSLPRSRKALTGLWSKQNDSDPNRESQNEIRRG